MAYLRSSGVFRCGFENLRTRNIGGYGRHMSGMATKLVGSVEANKVYNWDVLSEKSKPHFGETRSNSTLPMPKEKFPRVDIDIVSLVEDEIKDLFKDIRQEIKGFTKDTELQEMSCFYVDGKGKAIRPLMATLMGKSLNSHITNGSRVSLSPCQRRVAMVAEMTHAASLIHDDLLDRDELRRGKPSMVSFNHQKVARAGNFLTGVLISEIQRLKDHDTRMIMYKMMRDLVFGEFLQLDGLKSENEDMFSKYLKVTHLKAASLFAALCEAEAVLSSADYFLREAASQYGRNIGMAFQLADDYKDFESDLAQGVVTAPVLLASKTHRELEGMILRGFSQHGDLERAFDLVSAARGLEGTLTMVQRYCEEAVRHATLIRESPYQEGLVYVGEMILDLIRK